MAQPSQPPTGLPPLALGHIFLRIGATAFGGLGTSLALIERELVTKRQWLTAAGVTEALTYTELAAWLHRPAGRLVSRLQARRPVRLDGGHGKV